MRPGRLAWSSNFPIEGCDGLTSVWEWSTVMAMPSSRSDHLAVIAA